MLALAAAALAAPTLVVAGTPPAPAAVEGFIRLDISDMTPSYIESMMAVNETSVPKRLRRKFQAKKLELHTYRQLGEGQRKGTVRVPGNDCALPKEGKSKDASLLLLVGYVEISDDDVQYLEKNTHCSERKMMCEFSLQIIYVRNKRSKRDEKRYFLHPRDPLMALIGEYHSKGGNRDTPFFGRSPFPVCGGD